MTTNHYCAFCGRHKDFVAVLVAGPKAYICDECVKQSQEVIDDFLKKKSENAK